MAMEIINTTVQEQLAEAWVAFLSRWEWEWFATFTFRDITHPESADKRFRVLISKGNRELYGPRWHKKNIGIQWVRAMEMQKRGVLHFHALLNNVQNLHRLEYMEIWNEMAGYARIMPVISDVAVRRYVSKYVIKGGEIDLSKNLDKDRQIHLALHPGAESPAPYKTGQ